MPTATQSHTTPTRRSALGFSAAAIIAGMTTPVLASAAKPDAKLLDLVKTMTGQWEVTEVIAEEGHFLPPGITPQSEDQEARLEEALTDWWDTVDQIVDTPARSPIGLRAKAEAMQGLLAHMTFTDRRRTKAEQLADADTETRLAWSLAADLLAGSARA
jgi:hypothetical protein